MDSFFLALNGTGIEMDRPVYPADGPAILILSALYYLQLFVFYFKDLLDRCSVVDLSRAFLGVVEFRFSWWCWDLELVVEYRLRC